jgi:hypothetical protein
MLDDDVTALLPFYMKEYQKSHLLRESVYLVGHRIRLMQQQIYC